MWGLSRGAFGNPTACIGQHAKSDVHRDSTCRCALWAATCALDLICVNFPGVDGKLWVLELSDIVALAQVLLRNVLKFL